MLLYFLKEINFLLIMYEVYFFMGDTIYIYIYITGLLA